VVDGGNNRIETFTRDGTLLSVWDAPGGAMDPFDLAIDAHGNLYVSGALPLDYATNVAGQVIEFSPARQPLLTLKAAAGSSFSFPDGTVDAAGDILVQDNSGSIFTFSPTGKLLRQWTVWPQNSSPGVVRVAPSGQVYASGCISVAHCRIVALDAKGSIVRTWDSARPPDHPGSKVPTGRGYSLYLQCAGSGSPTVLWEAGSGDGGSNELPSYLLGRLAQISRVCFYDRAGLGLSDRALFQPNGGGAQMIADLHAVLQRAAVAGPYVLVGYSLGGLLNRLFAATYPKELAGMVQVDGISEDFFPDLGCTDTSCAAYSSITALHDAIHGKIAGSLGTLPLVLLTHNPALPAWGASSEPDFDKTEQALATASSNAVHVEATWSSHLLPFSQPGLVIEAVREVVAAARSSDHTLPRCGAAFTQPGGKCL